MASAKDATIERAREYAVAGQFVKAIAAWRELLDDSAPNDANIYNTIGDLCLKNKTTADAVDAYTKAARFFLQEGFHLKAIALYKKILKLEPDRADICAMLGDLNVVRGLMNNAIADYLVGAKMYGKAGKNTNALALFRKITRVDPRNTDVRLRVAELCLKEKLTDEAVEEYLTVGREYQRLQRADEARALYEQILKLLPAHAEARRRLDTPYQPEAEAAEAVAPTPLEMNFSDAVRSAAKLEAVEVGAPAPTGAEHQATLADARRLLADGDTTEAERIIRILLVEDAERDEYQTVLGMIYLKKGHASIAYDILHPIARYWLDAGRGQEALELIDAFLAVESDNADFLELKARSAVAPAAAPQAEQPAAAPSGETGGDMEFNLDEVEFPSSAAPAETADIPELEIDAPAVPIEAPELEIEPAMPIADASETEGAGAAIGDDARFEEFCSVIKEIKEQVGGKDFEIHYDLGVAYKEMGLVDEAIEEFQLAACGPTRFVDSCAMVAACYADQHRSPSAIAFLEQALMDSRCTGPGAPHVKYDLAVLYEDEGMTDKAARLYAEIPSIRDVEERLRRLQNGEEPVGQT